MNNPVAIAAAIFLLFLILFFNSIMYSVEGVFVSFLSPSRARDYKDDPAYKRAGIISFLISIPLFAFCLTNCGISRLPFGQTTIVLTAFTLIRIFADIIPGTINPNYKIQSETMASNSAFVLISLLSIPAAIYYLILHPDSNMFPKIWIGIVCTIFVSIRYFSVWKNFFSLKFSRFFTFLYLCGLKILPISVAVKVLVY